jgi:phage shock protein A
MLSKKQIIDASKCDDLKTMHDCVECKMYKTNDCVVALAKTALELIENNKQLKKEVKKHKKRYEELNKYVQLKYKDY